MKKNVIIIQTCILLVFTMLFTLVGCGSGKQNSGMENSSTSSFLQESSSNLEQSPSSSTEKQTSSKAPNKTVNLTKSVKNIKISGYEPDDTFINAYYNSTVGLFKNSVEISKNKNMLISPLSIGLGLAMTTNGADGNTKDEMEKVLGDLKIEDLNKYYYSYNKNLKSEYYKFNIANSIWTHNNFNVKEKFLKTNKNYYSADIFSAPFNERTAKDINRWVYKNTDGMIEEMVDEIDKDTVAYLINAIAFDAAWSSTFTTTFDDTFTNYKGKKEKVEMMQSEEYSYLKTDNATGFIKDYNGYRYGFAAILPDENIDIYEYIDGLDAKQLQAILKNEKEEKVKINLPKFECDYELELTKVLESLGMKSAFDANNANFSNLSNEQVCISEVLHKTFISVNKNGTKAAAATKVVTRKASIEQPAKKEVILNRPFIYMIIDNTTKMPIFIGTVVDI